MRCANLNKNHIDVVASFFQLHARAVGLVVFTYLLGVRVYLNMHLVKVKLASMLAGMGKFID